MAFCVPSLYLRVPEASDVRFEVVHDPPGRSWEGRATNQEHEQHDIWKGGGQIHHLSDAQRPDVVTAAGREGNVSLRANKARKVTFKLWSYSAML